MLRRLAAFHAEQGHASVPQQYEGDRKLAWWVTTQRRSRRKSKLTSAQIAALDGLGFDWSPLGGARLNGRWDTMFAALQAFREREGHCRVPRTSSEHPQLANWVAVQRRQRAHRHLSPERTAALDAVGFDWRVERGSAPSVGNGAIYNSGQERWEAMLQALVTFKERHGHCLVPQRWKKDRSLATWVSDQRITRNQGRIDPEREQRLTEFGFDWDPIGAKWETMFAQLVEFHREHRHCNAPQKSRRYGKLATWVHNQRCARKVGRRSITPERAKRLEALGFKWTLIDLLSWEAMFAKLVEFKSLHGHCKVPQKSGDKRFGKWVNTQRTQAKRGKLHPERQNRLEEIGFVWNAKPTSRATISTTPKCPL